MFTGFKNIAVPVYEVITPQSHLRYTVRSLSVGEEERLKGSLLSSGKVADHLNKCIFDVLVDKPESITDYKSFLENTTIKDRDALLFGLYHVTYEEIRNYIVKCPNCQKESKLTVKASDMFGYKIYPLENILTAEIAIPLPATTGVTAYLKQPTLVDEDEIYRKVNTAIYPINVALQTIVISKFEQDILESKAPIEWTDRNDIIDAYTGLRPKDKRAIVDAYADAFGQYCIELNMKYSCQFCGYSDKTEVDLVDNFFRMVLSA